MSKTKTYDVTIKTTIRKTYQVEANNEDKAFEVATYNMLGLLNKKVIPEDYEEEVEYIKEVERA